EAEPIVGELAFDHALEEPACTIVRPFAVAVEVVLGEHQTLVVGGVHLGPDVFHRPLPELAPLEHGNAAELAAERAALRGDDRGVLVAVLLATELAIRMDATHELEGRQAAVVERLQVAAREVVEDLAPRQLRLAGAYRVRMALRFLDHGGNVDATHHDLHAAPPAGRSDLV